MAKADVLVSVVMPAFNCAEHIGEAIDSVLSQTMQSLELIVIDDCSTDGTVEIIQGVYDPRVRVIRQLENRGSAAARNAGIEEAKGRFIAFLDSDDLWHPEKLEYQVSVMRDSEVPLSFTAYELIDHRGKRIGSSGQLPESVTYQELLRGCAIQNSTVLYDTSMVGKVFCPPVRKRQDFGLFLQILRDSGPARLVGAPNGVPLASYRILEESVSSNKLKNIPFQWQIYRDFEKMTRLKSIYYMLRWFEFAYRKNRRRLIS